MRIGINALTLVPGRTGGLETYIINLIKAIGQTDSCNRYVVFALPQAARLLNFGYPNISIVTCYLPTTGFTAPYLRVFYEQIILPYKIKHSNFDVMIFPANVGCLYCPCISVIVIHDLIRHYYREHFPKQTGFIKKRVFPRLIEASARAASKIVTVSEFTKREIVFRLGLPEDKVDVIYNGIEQINRGHANETADSSFISNLPQNISSPYVLFVGYQHLHKNLVRLVKAFAMMKDKIKTDHVLIIVGGKESGTPALTQEIKKLNRSDILVLGTVSSDDLADLYKKASLFVLPSLVEGFGLPLLEAMSYGVPIAASSAGSIPEVVGNAAVLFSPEDTESIRNAMEEILLDPQLAHKLADRGYERLKDTIDFSWHQTATKLVCIAESYDH